MEHDAELYAGALAETESARLSTASYLETAVVIDSQRDPVASRQVDNLIRHAGIALEAVTPEQAMIARGAYRDFGRGSGRPARLNFGDCFSYALAKVTDEPLLFKGDDFGQTDIVSALGPVDYRRT